MEFRSTNPEGYTHYGGDLMSGAHCTRGVLLSSNTIQPVSDNSNEDLHIRGKGTGSVYLNGSTTPVKLVSGESTVTPPDLAAEAGGNCTITISGLSTGDIVLAVDFRNTLSTGYLVSGQPYCDAANHLTIPIHNASASTISNSTGVTVRWLYLDRT